MNTTPLAQLFEAELVDGQRLVYQVPRGRILAVFEGRPGRPGEDHPLAYPLGPLPHVEMRSSDWSADRIAPAPGRCCVSSDDGIIRLGATPAYPITALVVTP